MPAASLVLDASVVVKWFRWEGERHVERAASLRTQFESGALIVFAPPLLRLELVDVAARRWRWNEEALSELATALATVGFEFLEPELERVARWAGRGLTAYDATYVALAEEERIPLVTDDESLLSSASGVAVRLAAA